MIRHLTPLLATLCLAFFALGGGPAPAAAEEADAQEAPSWDEAPSDVWERIERGYGMPELKSPLVEKWVAHYSKDPAYLKRMLDRSSRYLYHIVEAVEARNMPTELALLPFVESAFQPEALSRAKAAGLWQFMPATGNVYSLEQNLWRDQRRDVLESTRAALDYFEYLYGMFNDWQLALAAYNWGEGSVQRAVARARSRNQPADYAHLRMPNETANYVPKLMAIKRIFSNPSRYGIELPDVGNEPFFVRLTKPRDIDMETAAELAGMKLADFRALNPGFKLPVIVAAHNNAMLLPADKVDLFIDNLASWMDNGQPLSRWATYRLKEGDSLATVARRAGMTENELREVNGIPRGRNVLANSTLLVLASEDERAEITAEEADARLRLSPQTTWRRVAYRVRSGDTLDSIARRWHITPGEIYTSNRLRTEHLRAGQKLVLTVPNVQRASIQQASNTSARGQASAAASSFIHTVKKGETVSSISKRYGVTPESLRSANRLSGNTIRVGQRLRVPGGGGSVLQITRTYKVKPGDTLEGIARAHNVTATRLARANHVTNTRLKAGETLEIPVPEEKAPAANPAPSGRVHVVQSGDTLTSIGSRYGVSVESLRSANGLRGSSLKVGDRLVIPATAARASEATPAEAALSSYTVQSGDTLTSIAKRFGTTVAALRSENRLRGSSLSIGQKLRIPR